MWDEMIAVQWGFDCLSTCVDPGMDNRSISRLRFPQNACCQKFKLGTISHRLKQCSGRSGLDHSERRVAVFESIIWSGNMDNLPAAPH